VLVSERLLHIPQSRKTSSNAQVKQTVWGKSCKLITYNLTEIIIDETSLQLRR